MYHVDPWWNPAKTTQASDRVHRIGQERDVTIVHLHVVNSIEDSIRELQDKKKTVAHAVVGEAKVTQGILYYFFAVTSAQFIVLCLQFMVH